MRRASSRPPLHAECSRCGTRAQLKRPPARGAASRQDMRSSCQARYRSAGAEQAAAADSPSDLALSRCMSSGCRCCCRAAARRCPRGRGSSPLLRTAPPLRFRLSLSQTPRFTLLLLHHLPSAAAPSSSSSPCAPDLFLSLTSYGLLCPSARTSTASRSFRISTAARSHGAPHAPPAPAPGLRRRHRCRA
jgi:hypothetical protein